MRIVFILLIIPLLVYLISTFVNIYLTDQKMKREQIAKRRKEATLQFLRKNKTKNIYELSDEQEQLIRYWLEWDWFKDHRERFNTIIKDDKYSREDKEILSKLRQEYVMFRKNNGK